MFFCLSILSLKAQNWKEQASNTSDLIRVINVINQDNIWLGTSGGNVIRTTNGGTNWVVKTKPKANYIITTMFALDVNTAWAAIKPSSGNDFRLAKTTDGGGTWSESVISANSSYGDVVYFWDANEGVLVGDPTTTAPNSWVLKRTTDGGTTWLNLPAGNIQDADGENGEICPSNAFTVVGNTIMFVSTGNATFFTPLLYKSTDRGLTWNVKQIYSFTGMVQKYVYLAFKDENNGIAVNTAGFITKTTDGGETWSDPLSVNTAGFNSINYVSENTYIITGANNQSSSLCYITKNGGTSWKQITMPDGFGKMYATKFANSSKGWIGGEGGKLATWNGGDITINHIQPIQVLFKINMKYQMKRRIFIPDRGDYLCIGGTFNGWEPIDIMTDEDGDSIYTKLVSFDFNYRQEFKFRMRVHKWGSANDFVDKWENDPNRSQVFNQAYTVFNGGYFNNDFFYEQLDFNTAIPIFDGQKISGSNAGGTNNVTKYLWYDYSSGSYTGPEKIYKIEVTDSCRLIANLSNVSNNNLDVFILSHKDVYTNGHRDENNKAWHSDAKPGTYYIVVDGWNNATGSYDLTVQCQSGKPKGNIIWYEDFEKDANLRWIVTGQEWGIGEIESGPTRPAYGSKCAKTNLYGNYDEGRRTYLYRPESFIVPAKELNPRLTFWHWYDFNTDDWGNVRLRVDRGNGTYSDWKVISRRDFYNNSSGVWTQSYADLSDYADSLVQIGFYFESNLRNGYYYEVSAGWCIDNVSLVTGDFEFKGIMNFDTEYAGDWYMEGVWEVGFPTYASLSYSFPNAAATKLNGNYNEDARDVLSSPYFVVPPAHQLPKLKFEHFYRFNTSDFGKVMIREKNSTSWSDITGANFSEYSTGWNFSPSFDLLNYSKQNVRIRFLFESNRRNGYYTEVDAGWFIDDIRIEPINTVVLTSHNNGVLVATGSEQEITWFAGVVNNINLYYSTDNGANWIAIASNIPATQKKYTWVVPNMPTDNAQLKIENAEDVSIYDFSSTSFKITPVVAWSGNISIKDNTMIEKVLTFGTSVSATDGIDEILGEFQMPPLPPAGVLDARFALPVEPILYSPVDFRKDNKQEYTWVINIQATSNLYPLTITWTNSTLPSGNFYLVDDINGNIVNVNMKTNSACTISNSSITKLKIVYTQEKTFNMLLNQGWNLVSIPKVLNNMNANAVFTQTNSPVFGFDNTYGYTTQNLLTLFKGYWVNNA
ncbi:MAG TPA: hypothetical protein PL041_13670, partial [Melioribacteraceae bacterium]|nr:hypothetical protein [Melioribacteraceae bacterium]